MIQPQELRIGNLLDVDGNIIKVGRIDENLISWNVAKDTAKFKIWNPFLPISDKRISPIPLTEEILLKFGYIGNEPVFSEKSTIFTLGIHKIWKPFNIFLDEYYRFEIKYVHQLQNLFFSLCGEELKFKDIS